MYPYFARRPHGRWKPGVSTVWFCFMGLSKTSGADIYDAATVRCTNGALISVSGSATLPVQAAVEGDVTTATKQIDNKVFGTVRRVTLQPSLDL